MTNSKKQLINAHKAIGVIDSGVGGLTVVKEISRNLHHESIVYFSDTARILYGPRPNEEVRRFGFLNDQILTAPGDKNGGSSL